MVSSTLAGCMAQRLVRKICPHCTEKHILDDDQIAMLGLSVPANRRLEVRRGSGCQECRGTGYYGRTGVFEVMAIEEQIKHLIVEGADAPRLKREAIKAGMTTLRQSALRKLARGITSVEEVVRVTGV